LCYVSHRNVKFLTLFEIACQNPNNGLTMDNKSKIFTIKIFMVILYNIAVSKTRASDFKLTCAFYEKHFHTCEKKSIIAVKQ
jgi:hypothetical protein